MKEQKRAALTAAFLLLICIAYLLAGVLFGLYIPCPFRALTGFMCPGCGLSHAASDLVRLDIRAAFSDNALFAPIFLYILFAAYRVFYPEITGKKDPRLRKAGERIDIVFLIVILFWWVLRNVLSI